MKPFLSWLLAALLSTPCVATANPLQAIHSFFFPSAYRPEAPLPKDWPAPGPFDQATLKSYPVSLAAISQEPSPNRAFRALFQHIKTNQIPMSAPVMMQTDIQTNTYTQMAFLYPTPSVTAAESKGSSIRIEALAPQKVLSYAWLGRRSNHNIQTARLAIEKEAERLQLPKPIHYRVLGYNSPFIPWWHQTHELQGLLK